MPLDLSVVPHRVGHGPRYPSRLSPSPCYGDSLRTESLSFACWLSGLLGNWPVRISINIFDNPKYSRSTPSESVTPLGSIARLAGVKGFSTRQKK